MSSSKEKKHSCESKRSESVGRISVIGVQRAREREKITERKTEFDKFSKY